MLGKLHIASYALLIGAGGQYWFYKGIFPNAHAWIIGPPVFLPWVLAFAITFVRQAPFGPRPFRLCLLFVTCWYALVTIGAEMLHFLGPIPPDTGHFSIRAARVLMYLGFLSFIPFAWTYIVLRRYGSNPTNAGGPSQPSSTRIP